MPFIGAINTKLRNFFQSHTLYFENKKCYIGCSGNFTIEQILSRGSKNVAIHSNDVSLYSSAIGFALTGRKLFMQIINDEISWAQKNLDAGGAEQIAALLLIMDILQYEKQNNDYQRRMYLAYQLQWETMLKKTIEQVSKALNNIKIEEYTMVDVFDYYPHTDGISIGFLPTYVGGYEKLFKRMDESIKWESPAYEILTAERRLEVIQKMTQGEYLLYDDVQRDLPVVAQVELFGKKNIYMYSNISFKRAVFGRKINEKICRYNLLMPENEISDDAEVFIKETDLLTINHYRNLFLSKKIQPGAGGPCYLFFVENKLFGFAIFQAYSKKGGADTSSIYLLSDFVVPSSAHNRLSKLLLLALKTKEMKTILDERLIFDYKTILTTAFTNKPVSMKYRGIFELKKRGEDFLNYEGQFEENLSLAGIVKLWKNKYEKH